VLTTGVRTQNPLNGVNEFYGDFSNKEDLPQRFRSTTRSMSCNNPDGISDWVANLQREGQLAVMDVVYFRRNFPTPRQKTNAFARDLVVRHYYDKF
jgi:hypothetical protein